MECHFHSVEECSLAPRYLWPRRWYRSSRELTAYHRILKKSTMSHCSCLLDVRSSRLNWQMAFLLYWHRMCQRFPAGVIGSLLMVRTCHHQNSWYRAFCGKSGFICSCQRQEPLQLPLLLTSSSENSPRMLLLPHHNEQPGFDFWKSRSILWILHP